MKRLVVLTGAGISAESGIKTFRDMGGLWESYDVMEVASIDGWHKNKKLVLDFYNQRRLELLNVKPNDGHLGLVELEKYFNVQIITQNVDDLHERAGSKKILHLHGELNKACSTGNPELIYDVKGKEIHLGDRCAEGYQLRPYIVWFGEAVPAIEEAIEMVCKADVLAVIGTSLNVYPAAGLLHYAPQGTPIYVIDPNEVAAHNSLSINYIQEKATVGVKLLTEKLLKTIK